MSADSFPPLDFAASAYTGWTRAHWEALLARMTYGYVLAAERSGSPARALYPDDRRGLPDGVDGIESFARIASAWGAWLSNPANPASLAWAGRTLDLEALLCQALVEGTDSANPYTYWGDIGHMDQRIVESADIALALWLSRPRVFDRLAPAQQAQVLGWLAQVDGKGVYFDNWFLFPAMAQAVRLRLGQPVPLDELDHNLDRMAEFYRGDGWYVDGLGEEIELYNAWMFNGHYLHWTRIDGQRRPEYTQRLLQRSRAFLASFLHFFGANGAYPAWGRSLVYRFAAVGCLQLARWLGAEAGLAPASPGVLRRASSGCLRYFYQRGLFDPEHHHLTNGYHGHFPPAGEPYISPGSVYWCSRGLFALAFHPADEFWTAPEGPLPVEQGDFELVLPAPGFVVSGRRATGQVLLLNSRSGQDHESPGYHYAAKYGKFAYSTHFPFNVLAARGVPAPDSMVALTRDGRAFGHRGRTLAGGAAPGLMWCHFAELLDGEAQPLWVAVLLWGDRQVRLTRLSPTFPVMAWEAPAALGCAAAVQVCRRSEPAAGWEYAEAEGRAVAIRRLLGYDAQRASAPFLDQSNLNLAYPYAEQPLVGEAEPSVALRCLAAVSLARPAPFDPAAELAGVRVTASPDGAFHVSLAEADGAATHAFVAVGAALPSAISLNGVAFSGDLVRYARLSPGAQALSGLGVSLAAGIAEFAAPAAFHLAREAFGRVTLATDSGLTLDPTWLGGPLRRVSLLPLGGEPIDVTLDCGEYTLPPALIRRWAQQTQRRLLTFRAEN